MTARREKWPTRFKLPRASGHATIRRYREAVEFSLRTTGEACGAGIGFLVSPASALAIAKALLVTAAKAARYRRRRKS